MNGMKKWMIGILLCIMIPALAMATEAAPLPCAAQPLNLDAFSHYAASSCDEATGIWRVHGYTADAMLDQLWEYGEINTLALSAFHLELEGNIRTGIMTPVFRFYYVDGKKPIQATAVSFLIDGVRYDLAAASTGKIAYGKEEAEIISAPLSQDALPLLSALVEGKAVSVRLLGKQNYTMELSETTAASKRNAIQSASLAAVKADMDLLQKAGMNDYALWDLSAAAWETAYGFAPAYAVSEVSDMLCRENISDPFGMLLPASEGKAARAALEMLIRHGFLVGNSATLFDENTSAAVSRAQKYYGLIVTGCMDSQLENAMNSAHAASVPQQDAPALQSLGDNALIALDRYWFADGVSAARGAEIRAVSNADNTLLIADGLIQNISPNTMHLFMQLEAQILYGEEYVYEATILCQKNHETMLDTMLLPLEQTRLIVCVEIPEHLANAPADQWRIQFTMGGYMLEYSLK